MGLVRNDVKLPRIVWALIYLQHQGGRHEGMQLDERLRPSIVFFEMCLKRSQSLL